MNWLVYAAQYLTRHSSYNETCFLRLMLESSCFCFYSFTLLMKHASMDVFSEKKLSTTLLSPIIHNPVILQSKHNFMLCLTRIACHIFVACYHPTKCVHLLAYTRLFMNMNILFTLTLSSWIFFSHLLPPSLRFNFAIALDQII
jgi:hypothetical protein